MFERAGSSNKLTIFKAAFVNTEHLSITLARPTFSRKKQGETGLSP
jgi:hypothetical protein